MLSGHWSLPFFSSGKEKNTREKLAAQASRIVSEDGFPTYHLTSKRLQDIQEKHEALIELKRRQRYLQNLLNYPTTNAEKKISIRAELMSLAQTIHAAEKNLNFKFIVFGCQGNAKEDQKRVAALINAELAKDPLHKPDFILILGDNFYDNGVSGPLDEMFKTHFDDIYAGKETEIGKIPCFVILGNHDENFHKLHYGPQGIEVGLHQVIHSYLDNHLLYQQRVLDLDHLPNWNMPARAYSLFCQDTEIFCIDSSLYALDYLRAKHGDRRLTNQTVWLEKKVKQAQAAGRKVILASHHSLVTQGKRAFQADLDVYLSKTMIETFKELLPGFKEDISYNALLNNIITHEQGLVFNSIVSAHDHFQAYYNNNAERDSEKFISQLTAGGGGGGKHNRRQFKTQSKMGYFSKESGFTLITSWFNQRILWFSTFINGQIRPIICNSNSPKPFQHYHDDFDIAEKDNIQFFHHVLRKALSDYFAFLGKHEPQAGNTSHQKEEEKEMPGKLWNFFKHGKTGVNRAHRLWSYLNQVEPDNLDITLAQVADILGTRRTTPTENSLITSINEHCVAAYGKTFEVLAETKDMTRMVITAQTNLRRSTHT